MKKFIFKISFKKISLKSPASIFVKIFVSKISLKKIFQDPCLGAYGVLYFFQKKITFLWLMLWKKIKDMKNPKKWFLEIFFNDIFQTIFAKNIEASTQGFLENFSIDSKALKSRHFKDLKLDKEWFFKDQKLVFKFNFPVINILSRTNCHLRRSISIVN